MPQHRDTPTLNTQNPSNTHRPPAAGWGPGEQRPTAVDATWGQGQKALRCFDSEYSSALGVGGEAHTGGGGEKTQPRP